MADENLQAAESSTATATEPLEIPSSGSPEYAEWRLSGKLPEKAKPAEKKPQPKPEDSATSTEHSESGHASEAGNQGSQEKGKSRSTAESRLNELLADLKTAGLSPAELKTFRREAQAQQQGQEKPQAQAKPESTEKPAQTETTLKRPKMTDFNTYEEYEAALDKYNEDAVAQRVEKALQENRVKEAQEAQNKQIGDRMKAASERYGAESGPLIVSAAKAINDDPKVSPVVKQMLAESGAAVVDVMYALASKPEEFQAFVEEARSNPGKAIRRIALVEQLVQEELAKGSKAGEGSEAGKGEATTPERGEDGKFQKPAEKQVTKAPPPPREAAGRSGAPPNESDEALKANDFRRFREAENRKDLARRTGR